MTFSVFWWMAVWHIGFSEILVVYRSCGAGMVICLERGADLHTAQLMPLPLTVCVCVYCSCFVLRVQGDESEAVNRLVCHVHYRPDAVLRWVRLAQFLLSQFAESRHSNVAHCCQVAVTSSDVNLHAVSH